MRVRLFGELEAEQAGVPVPVRGAKQRALLALLALRPGQPVSADRLIDVLWGDGQAANPANALQAQIGQLRRTFGAAGVITTEAGYALDAGPDEVDAVRFEHLVAQGQRLAEASQPADASAALGEALGLRRGEPLADFTSAGLFDAERTRLDELTWWRSRPGPGPTLCWAVTVSSPPSWRPGAGRTRCVSACGSCSSWPCTGPDGRPRPCAPTPTSATAWPTSSASTPARPCATCRPASWPSIPRSVRDQTRPDQTRLRRHRPGQQPCSRRSCISRGPGAAWCRVRG
jgi:DNA-binding winged helix-turn-helix (wHTH) protein